MTKPAKKRLALIPVERCLDCPKHEMVADPSSGDSFDIGDQSLCCTATEPPAGSPKTYFGRTYPGRVVVACERPGSSAFRRAEIPGWCPHLRKREWRAEIDVTGSLVNVREMHSDKPSRPGLRSIVFHEDPNV